MLILIWEEDENDYYYLIKLIKCVIMLFKSEPQNKHIQKSTYEFFISNPNSEIFFSKIFEIIKLVMSQNKMNKTTNKMIQKLILQILRLFQLFCEGHYYEMQTYLSEQFNSKNSFDMIQAVANLTSSFIISCENYKIIIQCFETLSEFIQVFFK